jgi:hypothetical protein
MDAYTRTHNLTHQALYGLILKYPRMPLLIIKNTFRSKQLRNDGECFT